MLVNHRGAPRAGSGGGGVLLGARGPTSIHFYKPLFFAVR